MEMPLWDPERVVIVFDHVMPANTVAAAEMHRSIREFVVEHGVRHLFQEGICHQLMVEKGFARPGGLIVGADSHSTTYGALGCFGTGLGSSDIGIVYATGRTWFRIPETLRINLHGELQGGVDAKDVALHVIRQLGAEGANYLAVEWGGETVRAMNMAQRLTLANLSIDFGAKAGLIEADAVTREYLGGDPDMLEQHPEDPSYLQVLDVEVEAIPPQVAVSPAIDNVQDIGRVAGTPLDEIFIGSCTNGRLEDLAIVAGYLAGGMTSWREEKRAVERTARLTLEEFHARWGEESEPPQILDVRELREWEGGYIPGSVLQPYHDIRGIPEGIDADKPVAVVCGSGQRAAVGASLLQRAGASEVIHVVEGGVPLWKRKGWPIEQPDQRTD